MVTARQCRTPWPGASVSTDTSATIGSAIAVRAGIPLTPRTTVEAAQAERAGVDALWGGGCGREVGFADEVGELRCLVVALARGFAAPGIGGLE
jgi:hypothetical protein